MTNFIFDAYGTIVHNPSTVNLYKELIGSSQIPSPMISNIEFKDFVKNINIPESKQEHYINLMDEEISNIYLDQEAFFLISDLKDRGHFISVASNLANPYSIPIKKFYNDVVDSFIFSYEVGFKKPDEIFYQMVIDEANKKQKTNFSSFEFMMIGDSYKNDFLGPLRYGISSLYHVNEDRKVHWKLIRNHLGKYL